MPSTSPIRWKCLHLCRDGIVADVMWAAYAPANCARGVQFSAGFDVLASRGTTVLRAIFLLCKGTPSI